MVTAQSFERVLESLKAEFADSLIAVALFGSAARGEARPDSDLDFLVVLSDRVPEGIDRRSRVYRCIHRAVTASGISRDVTVMDMNEKFILDTDAEVTPIILNLAADAIILYDHNGELGSFVRRVRKIIELAGLERYAAKGGTYGWKPKDGILRAVEA